MQTILGAGGAIGSLLAKELAHYESHIRLVSRQPHKMNETDELFAGDITDKATVEAAVGGSSVVYLTAGLDYKAKVWENNWPVIMQNAIEACKKHGARLVFFDNVYMYDPEFLENMTEETPVRPVSRKGRVRAQIAGDLLNEMQGGRLQGMIVRAADFYGPGVRTSVMLETVYKKLKAGKKAVWLGDPHVYHTMTFTPDAAKATALLGNTADAWQQIWHLPSEEEKLTGKQWVALFASALGKPAKFTSFSGNTIRFMGLLVPFFKEVGEMMYQFERNYFFNSRKFQERFPNFKITSAAEGVREVIGQGY